MKGFHKFDLQTLGEIAFMFEQMKETGDIPIEQKNKAEFYARYCRELQRRLISNTEAGKINVLSS